MPGGTGCCAEEAAADLLEEHTVLEDAALVETILLEKLGAAGGAVRHGWDEAGGAATAAGRARSCVR